MQVVGVRRRRDHGSSLALQICGFGIVLLCVAAGVAIFYPDDVPHDYVAEAKRWAAVPKTHLNGTIVEQGIHYAGDCSPVHRKYPKDFDGTWGACSVTGSGSNCRQTAAQIYDLTVMPRPASRRLLRAGAAGARRHCTDSYQPWFKVKIPKVGTRCAFRFGVDTAHAEIHGKGNADLVDKLFAARPTGSPLDASWWGVNSAVAKDSNTCVVAFQDPRMLIVFASHSVHISTKLVIISCSCILATLLFCCALYTFATGALPPLE